MPGCPSLVSCIPEGLLPGVPPTTGSRDLPAQLSMDAHWPGAMLWGDGSKQWGKSLSVCAQGGPHAQKARVPVLCQAASWGSQYPCLGRAPAPSPMQAGVGKAMPMLG